MARASKYSRTQRSRTKSGAGGTENGRRSAFSRKRQQLDHEQERVRRQLAEMQRLIEETPKREAAQREAEQIEMAKGAGARLIRLDALAGSPSSISGAGVRRPRRKTKAQRQAEYAQLFLLAILCAALVFFAIQLFR